jgi:ABC-type glycerol-3-phosphate transport system substrate-binding protein
MTKESLSRRRFLGLGGALVTGGALAARGYSGVLAAPAGASPVKVTFWATGGAQPYCAVLDVLAREFSKTRPDIEVQTECVSDPVNVQTALLARIAAGNPPDGFNDFDTPIALAARGALEPIDDLMAQARYARKENIPAAALSSCQYGGQMWGLPVRIGPMAFFYNVDWFARKGIPTARDKFPKTWDELRKLSKEFTHWQGDTLQTAGYIPMLDDNWRASYFVWSALNGGTLYDAAHRRYTIDAEPNVAMMEYMLAWLNEEYRGDMTAVARSGGWGSYPDANGRPPDFQGGRLATYVSGSYFLGEMYLSGAMPTFRHFNVASFPLGPGGTKVVSGIFEGWLVIPRGASHRREIFAFFDYMCVPGQRVLFNSTPMIPAITTAPRNLLPGPTVQYQGLVFAQDVMKFFYHQLDISIPMWNSPVQTFAGIELNKAITRIMYKVAKPKDALAEAQRACQSQLASVAH